MTPFAYLDANPCLLKKCGVNTERNCPNNEESNDCTFLEQWILNTFNNKPIRTYKLTEETRERMSQARQGRKFSKVTTQ